MNQDVFNLSIRKFLKQFGVTAQRDIEHAVEQAIREGRLSGSETLTARATLTIEGLGELTVIAGDLTLG